LSLTLKSFKEIVKESIKEKKSILCASLDPALPTQREKDVISVRYLSLGDDSAARLSFCLDLIDEISDLCAAVKVNEQYVKGFSLNQHKALTNEAFKAGLASIYDLKLGDIGDSVEAALFHVKNWGYNALTVNPFPGNLKHIIKKAAESNIGVLTLTLMSNVESIKYFKQSKIDGKPVYLEIAREVKECNGDGCIIGISNYVTEIDIKNVREIIGEEKIILFPGIGAQKGNPEKAIKFGGENILINVGRAIIYSENPKRKAEEYKKLFNEIKSMKAYR
jgi:orotidine-5'-phosphate decarboxylase